MKLLLLLESFAPGDLFEKYSVVVVVVVGCLGRIYTSQCIKCTSEIIQQANAMAPVPRKAHGIFLQVTETSVLQHCMLILRQSWPEGTEKGLKEPRVSFP